MYSLERLTFGARLTTFGWTRAVLRPISSRSPLISQAARDDDRASPGVGVHRLTIIGHNTATTRTQTGAPGHASVSLDSGPARSRVRRSQPVQRSAWHVRNQETTQWRHRKNQR